MPNVLFSPQIIGAYRPGHCPGCFIYTYIILHNHDHGITCSPSATESKQASWDHFYGAIALAIDNIAPIFFIDDVTLDNQEIKALQKIMAH